MSTGRTSGRLAAATLCGYLDGMSTLSEIETVVAAWPRPQQEELCRFLSDRLRQDSEDRPACSVEPRRRWLEKLARLREETSGGQTGASLQTILDELRDDR